MIATPQPDRSTSIRGKLDWQQVIFRSVDTIVQGCSIAQQYKGFQGYKEALIVGSQLIDVIMVPYRSMPEYREEREKIIFATKLSEISEEYKRHPEKDGLIDDLTRAKKLMEAALAAAAVKGVLGIETIVNAEE
jgi:hypothetical protein